MSARAAVAPTPATDDAYEAAAREHRRRAYVLASYRNKPDDAAKTAARAAHEAAAVEFALLHLARLAIKARP